MFFWWICGGESVLAVLLLCHLSSSPALLASWYVSWAFAVAILPPAAAAAAAKSIQPCPTLCDPRDGSLPGSRPWDSPGKNTGVGCHFLLQCMKVKVKSLSRVRLLATPWTAALQDPRSMGVSRQEYWSGVPLPSPIGAYIWAMILVHAWFPGFFLLPVKISAIHWPIS